MTEANEDACCQLCHCKRISFFAGLWEAIPMEEPNINHYGCYSKIHPVTYNRVRVSGCTATLTMTGDGGNVRRSCHQVLSIHKTPRGTVYLDDKRFKCTYFSAEDGIIRVKNAHGYGMLWRRLPMPVVANQPALS